MARRSAAAAVERWRGGPPPPHWAQALAAGRTEAPGAAGSLAAVIVDPTGIALADSQPTEDLGASVGRSFADRPEIEQALADSKEKGESPVFSSDIQVKMFLGYKPR